MLKARRKKSEDKLGHKSLTTTEKYLAESDLKATHMRALADKAFSF